MNPAPDHITQSIVHVLDEWAKAAPGATNVMSAFADKDRLDRAWFDHWHDDHWLARSDGSVDWRRRRFNLAKLTRPPVPSQ